MRGRPPRPPARTTGRSGPSACARWPAPCARPDIFVSFSGVMKNPGAMALTRTPRVRPLGGERSGQGDHRGLGHRVDAAARPAAERRQRADVDDAAAARARPCGGRTRCRPRTRRRGWYASPARSLASLKSSAGLMTVVPCAFSRMSIGPCSAQTVSAKRAQFGKSLASSA